VHPEYGAGVEEVEDEVPLGDRIQRVRERLHPQLLGREPGIYGMRRTAQRRRAQRRDARRLRSRLEPSEVPAKRLEVGEQVVGEQDRLSSLKMGVSG
jgi:hypothetical protein